MSLSSISSAGSVAVVPAAPLPAATAAAVQTPSTTAASTTSDSSSAATPYVAQILQAASTLSDSSNAPIQDKLNAWTAIFNAVTAKGPGGGPSDNAWYTQSTQAQRDVVNNIYANSQASQQIATASQQFNQAGVAIDRASNGAIPGSQSQLARLNALSPLQQQIVFTGTATYANSLDDWKTALAQEPGASASNSTSTPAVSVSLSSAAQAALGLSGTNASSTSSSAAASTSSDGTSAAAQALKTLTSAPPTDSGADVALAVLKSAAKANAAASAQTSSEKKASATAASKENSPSAASTAATTPAAYQAGDTVSITA